MFGQSSILSKLKWHSFRTMNIKTRPRSSTMTSPPRETGCHQGGWCDILVDSVLKILKGKGKSLRNTHTKKRLLCHWVVNTEGGDRKFTKLKHTDAKAWHLVCSQWVCPPGDIWPCLETFLIVMPWGILGIWWAEARDAANTPQHTGQPCNTGTWPLRAPWCRAGG